MNGKRTLTLTLAVCMLAMMIIGPLAGCSSSGGGKDTMVDGKMEISIAIWNADATITDETDAMYKALCDKVGVTFKPINMTWDDYEEKIPTWASSGNLPDIFAMDAIDKAFYSTWIKEEIIAPFPDDLSKYPHLKAYLDLPEMVAERYSDGKTYGVPRAAYLVPENQANEKGLMIRKDWMEALGYTEDPENLEELTVMLKDLMENNPEGNTGVVGITTFNIGYLLWLMWPYSTFNNGGADPWVTYDGRWIPASLTPAAREGIIAIGEMWNAGVIDRDLPNLKENDGADKFASGRAVAYTHTTYPSVVTQKKELFAKTYPDKEFSELFKFIKPMKNKDGNLYYYVPTGNWSETYMNGNISEAKKAKVCELLDYMLSPEGLRLLRYGIEGVDYKMENGEPVFTRTTPLAETYPLVSEEGLNVLAIWDQDWQYENPLYDPYVSEICNGILHYMFDNGISDAQFQNYATAYAMLPDTVNPFRFDENAVVAITSGDAAATWDKLVQEAYEQGGLEEYIKAYNDLFTEKGIKPLEGYSPLAG